MKNHGRALGLIEAVGLVAILSAADAALKAAPVEVDHFELPNGAGMVMIRIHGEQAAVAAAVAAGVAAGQKLSKRVVGSVIGNPQLTI